MTDPLVGRDDELSAVARALDGPGVLIEGPAGIGKTAIWRRVLADVAAEGVTVLPAAPTESERLLPYAALTDLLRPLADEMASLPAPQAAAAKAVTVSGDVSGPVDERTVGVMVQTLLAGACTVGRPVLAIDDCQWLDAPSARALRYALRRMDHRPRILLAWRGDGQGALPLGLDEADSTISRIVVPPLGVGALHHVLRQHLGITLNRPLLTRLTVESEGNPMLALELARAVMRLPALPRPGDDLPVSRSVQELVSDTLAALPERTLTALRLTALLTAPTLADLLAAGTALGDLDPAEEAGLVRVGDGLRFSHPLHAAAVRAGIPDGRRRSLQLRLADAVSDPDERARQLARAIINPDEAVAAELEASGRRHWARGVPGMAADLLERAAALTPQARGSLSPKAPGFDATGTRAPSRETPRARRLLAALRARYDSGDHAATAASVGRVAESLTGDDKASALLIGAVVAFVTEGHAPAVRCAEGALRHADPGGEVAGRVHAHLAVFEDRPLAAVTNGVLALDLIRDTALADHSDMRSSAMLSVFYNEARAGLPTRPGLLDDALELEGDHPSWLAGSIPGLWWTAVDDHERARARMQSQLAHARTVGDEPLQLEVQLHLVQSLVLDGRLDDAERELAHARALGEQLGGGLDEQDYLAAQLGIYRGDHARFAPLIAAGLGRARRENDTWGMRVYGVLDGQLALHEGDHARAARSYGDLAATMSAQGVAESLALRWEPDWIEACVGAGDLDGAADVMERLAERHRRLPRPWTALGLARSRVLVLAAQRVDTTAALAELDAALAGVPEEVLPLDRARCLLVAGVAHRRARRRARAKDYLERAVRGFEALEANAFAARAHAELERSGIRAGSAELTATERRVAMLAAQGGTNRAIAETLFISAKTVEANLARAYRKLGITTRAELGATFGAGSGDNSLRGGDTPDLPVRPRT